MKKMLMDVWIIMPGCATYDKDNKEDKIKVELAIIHVQIIHRTCCVLFDES